MWCNHTVALTQPQLVRNPILFSQIDQIFICSNNLSTVAYAFARCMLISLSDDMLLLMYVNEFTNLKGLPPKVKIAPSCLKKGSRKSN